MLNCLKQTKYSLGILISSIGLIVLSVCVKWAIVPYAIKFIVWDYMQLIDGTLGYDVWKSPPVPVYSKFYIFNVTNPNDVKTGKKPHVEEIGPFVYREIRDKRNIRRIEDEITYGFNILYRFDEELSCDKCRPDTKVIVPNAPLLSSVGLLESISGLNNYIPFIGRPIETILNLINSNIGPGEFEDTLFHEVEVGKLLFDGYSPGALRYLLKMLNDAGSILPAGLLPELPDMMKAGLFGLWYGKNDTMVDGYYTIDTGDTTMDHYAQVTKFNGQHRTPSSWWSQFGSTPSSHRAGHRGSCSEIHGTDGQQFHPLLTQEQDLWLFTPDLCRSVIVSYSNDEKVNGISTRRFDASVDNFNLTMEDNICYCQNVDQCAVEVEGEDRWDLSQCRHCLVGLLNSQGCQGAPAFGGGPHFLYADQSLLDSIDGLQPDYDKHSTYLNIEPYSGVSFSAHKRIQVSFHMKPVPEISLLNNVPELYFPVMWFDQGAEIDQEWSDKFKGMVQTPLLLVDIFTYLGIGLGSLGIIVSVLAFMMNRQ